jgi:hypothetical protein
VNVAVDGEAGPEGDGLGVHRAECLFLGRACDGQKEDRKGDEKKKDLFNDLFNDIFPVDMKPNFPSFPRKRESSIRQQILDSRFRGNDDVDVALPL